MTDLQNQAHQAIHQATFKGKMKPARAFKCDYCGDQAEHYHHYNGYEKEHWFDVIPLCRPCHTNTMHDWSKPKKEKPEPRPFHQCEAWAKYRRCPGQAMRDSVYCGAHAKQAKNLIHYLNKRV